MDRFCDKILGSKYERPNPETRKWWADFFRKLEKDSSILEERLDRLAELLPPSLYWRLINILEMRDKKQCLTFTFDEKVLEKERTKDICRLLESSDTEKSLAGTETEIKQSDFQKVVTGTMLRSNPYLNFFKRHPNEVAVWREDPADISKMRLTEYADKLTEQITQDFIKTLNLIRGYDQETLSVQNIKEIFEIAPALDISRTLKVQPHEIKSVPQGVAQAMNLPAKSRKTILHREIRSDQIASRKKKSTMAFGRRLPPQLQGFTVEKDATKKWLKCERLPKKLQSMARVWQDITNLKSTMAYCEYILNNHPNLKAPKYLVNCGLFDRERGFSPHKDLPNFDNLSKYSF